MVNKISLPGRFLSILAFNFAVRQAQRKHKLPLIHSTTMSSKLVFWTPLASNSQGYIRNWKMEIMAETWWAKNRRINGLDNSVSAAANIDVLRDIKEE